MYLDKIEIHGFKSFGNAVKLSIPKGITGVIGPNGSGKSNVADAIRWVLGEQSAKSLRGSKMEDIIFAGTDKRKSLGYAEVAMTIKNDNKEVPIEYAEVAVKRRVYRSGESEYFINGSSCRLKDVQELFMDTGVGKEGYSIIGQGQIDRVLSSKPEERRTLFEEAAGIYKYKVRRQEAEKKLEKQRENLVRIHDILLEIESRLEPLSIEAEKTKVFLKLKEELKAIDINLFIYEIDKLDKELQNIDEALLSLEQQIQESGIKKEQQNEKNTYYKQLKNTLFSDIEAVVNLLSELEKEQERKNSQIQITTEKVLNIDKLLEQIEKERVNRQSDHQNKLDKLNFLQSKKTALEIEKVSKAAILAAETEKAGALSKRIEELESNIDASKKEMYSKIRAIDLLKAEINKQDEAEEAYEERLLQITDQVNSQNSDIQHQEVHIKVLEQEQNKIILKKEQNEKALKAAEIKKDLLVGQKTDKEKALAECSQDHIQAERQLKWLMHIKEEHEGFFGSVKQVLQIAENSSKDWQDIIGVVGELLDVPKTYEVAIVTALGSAIQHIVTRNESCAKAMIAVMKEKGISRVTFLPQDTVIRGSSFKEEAIRKERGFLGIASELVHYDKSYGAIVSSLLGRIVIVDDIHNASKIARKYQYKYKLVTLEGDVFNSGGSLSGGSTKQQGNNIFSRNREIKEMQQKISACEAEEKRLKQELEVLNAALQEVVGNWNTIRGKNEKLEEQEKTLILELQKAVQTMELTKQTQLQLLREKNTIEESIEASNASREAKMCQLQEDEEAIKASKEDLTFLEGSFSKEKEQKNHIEENLTEKKISLSSTEQNILHLDEQMKEIQETLLHQDERYAKLDESIANYLKEKESLLAHSELIKQEMAAIEEKIKAGHHQRVLYEDQKLVLEKDELAAEEETNKILEQLDSLKEEKYRLENKKESYELQKQNWGNTMWEQYEITYNHALSYKKDLGSIPEIKKLSIEKKAQIKQIGSVSVNAVEEYQETKTRYEFLSTQKADIEKAETSLLEMIQNLTEQMRHIFSEQFKMIAVNFTHVFMELFGGGEAYLELVDEENILESGIEIIAKPPGKKLQNMSLLSGGERTLTAISLLFGILKLKPSPFCVLDEIESALDDANVLRFADYLYKLSDETQFIVITHRKGTMERAHTLYGVTMQERGVSTVLSIQLEDAGSYLDQKKTS